MIELTFFALLTAQSGAPSQNDCTAIVDRVEVRRAVRMGQSDTIIEAADLVEGCGGREELLVLAAQTAWEEGDLDAVPVLASSALRLIGDRGCAWTPLAARLAFATGFARRAIGEDGDEFYFFVAGRVDDAASGLDNEWRAVAREFAEDFGTYPPDDIFAFGSPYIAPPYRVDETQCGDLPTFYIRFDAPFQTPAFAVYDLLTDEDGDIRRARLVMSYPGDMPRRLERRLRGRRSHDVYYDGYHMLAFDPCTPDWFIVDEEGPVCVYATDASE
ncbi:MAG: hypothetical protein DHS20C06_10930 [Hyphobacterium sp.]|nr:MAG: hypothetical protein DHS20C06_10930 [Hyphobacterium sp.]